MNLLKKISLALGAVFIITMVVHGAIYFWDIVHHSSPTYSFDTIPALTYLNWLLLSFPLMIYTDAADKVWRKEPLSWMTLVNLIGISLLLGFLFGANFIEPVYINKVDA